MASSETYREQQREKLIEQAIPNVIVNFTLKYFSVSFINNKDKYEGIEVFSKNFNIEFKKYEEINNLNINSFEIVAIHEDFGINSFDEVEKQRIKTKILYKLDEQSSLLNNENPYLSKIRLVKGNMNAIQHYNDVMLDAIDFDLNIEFKPVRIIYQVGAVKKLYSFFKVKGGFKDELKMQAYEKLESIKQSVSISDVLKNKSKSRLRIEIASPILVLPFKKNNDINSECWVFNMGNLLIQNYDPTINDNQILQKYKSYQVKITQIMMQHVKSYQLWLANSDNDTINVIKEFQMSFQISMKKDSEFINDSLSFKQQNPDTLLSGQMSELKIFLNPHIYSHLFNINTLLSTENSTDQLLDEDRQQILNEKNQVMKMASKMGSVKIKGNAIKYWYQRFGVLSGAYIYFYEKQSDISPKEYFYIKGCSIQKQPDVEENTLMLTNNHGEQFCIGFNAKKYMVEWEKSIQDKVYEMAQLLQTQIQLQNQNAEANSSAQERNKEQIVLTFDFQMPVIEVELYTEQKQDGGSDNFTESDQNDDIGIFSPFRNASASKKQENSQQEQSKWSVILSLQNMRLKQSKRLYDSDYEITLQSMHLKDYKNMRYPNIIYSNQNEQSMLINFNIRRQEKESPRYNNEDMTIDLDFGELTINWHPKTLNSTIRFLRYNKLQSQIIQQQQDIIQRLNIAAAGSQLNLPKDQPNNLSDSQQQRYNQQSSNLDPFKNVQGSKDVQAQNCSTISNILMKVNTRIQSLKIVLIHPLNDTYPISSVQLGDTQINFSMHYDHDFYQGKMGSFQVFDHTNYPLTLDPTAKYSSSDVEPIYEILGLRDKKEKKQMLEFDCIMYHHPIERTCPLQGDMYDKMVNLKLNSIKLNYMQEYIFRLNDYFLFQFLPAVSDSNPYQGIIDSIHKTYEEANKVEEGSSLLSKSEEEKDDNKYQTFKPFQTDSDKVKGENNSKSKKWKDFDLQQNPYCTGLNITMDKPLVILKDRPYLSGKLEINLGEIQITNITQETKGRWKSLPEKAVKTTTLFINAKKLGIKYDVNYFEMAPSFNMDIEFEKLNFTPLLGDYYQSKGIDFLELDVSYKIDIKLSQVQLRFRQDVYTFFMRCMDLNINYVDQMDKHFQLYFLNEGNEDNQKFLKIEKDTVKQFANKDVYKMKIDIIYPSFSIQIFNSDCSYMSELVLWNGSIEFNKYVDYRKVIVMKSHTLFILHNEQEYENRTKYVVIGPINSKKLIETTQEFYNFEINQKSTPLKRQKTQSKLNKKNFIVNMNFEPDGDKLIQAKIEKLKIFIKPHIFLMLYEMFVYGLPQYNEDSKDKPNFYDSDSGNAPRMEVGCQILQSLLCFENDPSQAKTIACQGNVSFTSLREKANKIKLRLLEIPLIEEEKESPLSSGRSSMVSNRERSSSFMSAARDSSPIRMDNTANLKLMQVSIQDLCPFFCSPSDLEGKNFKQVKKREMLSPFTLFYNRQDIIELAKVKDRLYVSQPEKYVFKMYSKIEANLERTMLKLSFNDFDILKGIMDRMSKMLNDDYFKFVKDIDDGGDSTTKTKDISNTHQMTEKEAFLTVSDRDEEEEEKEQATDKFSIRRQGKQIMVSQAEDDDNESEKSYLSKSSKSDEEEDGSLQKFKKLRTDLSNTKSKNFPETPSARTIQLKESKNFRQSIKNTQQAFSMIQRCYTKKSSLLNVLVMQVEDQEGVKDVMGQTSNSDLFTPKNQNIHKNGTSFSDIQETDMEDDIDEDDTEIKAYELKREGFNMSASKSRFEGCSHNHVLSIIKEERGVDQFQVVSHGLKILVINDNMYNFFPVLVISISEFHYSSDQNDRQKAGMTQFSSALNYYNAEAGEWEPFVETFKIMFTIIEDTSTKKRIFQCECPTQLSINITEKLVQNLSETYKSWQKLGLEEENEDKVEQEEKDKHEKELDNFLLSDRGGTARASSVQFPQQNKYMFDENDEEDDMDENQKDEEEEDIVTPYSICNKTNVQLIVKRLNNIGETGTTQDKKHLMRGATLGTSLAVRGGVGAKSNKLNSAYVINPGDQIDYAVDYDLQVRQQMSMYTTHQFSGQQGEFVKILFKDISGQGLTTGSMSIPLNNVNLNQIGCKKHFVRDDDQTNNSEFYVYGVFFMNMKKILTIRTQYLFVNQTLFNYEVHIRFKHNSLLRKLAPGESMPIPGTFDSCKFQIRIAQEQGHIETIEEEEEDSPGMRRHQTQQNREDIDELALLEDIMKKRDDIVNLQQISKNWSDLLIIRALKTKLPVNMSTFLKHGKTYTIIKKEHSQFENAFDINFRPPIVVKNCLPVPIQIKYKDSNGETDSLQLSKEEEKHIFVFNLQENVILTIQIQNYEDSNITLDCSDCTNRDIKQTIYDSQKRSLDIYINTSAKIAGKKVIFYVKNCVIDYTQQDLMFYYKRPVEKKLKYKTSHSMVAGMQLQGNFNNLAKKVYMLSNENELYAAISGSLEVSNPINIFNAGCKDKFDLPHDDFLYEYGYSTDIFLASKDDYVYTKITTVSPLYVIVNQTSNLLVIAQEKAKDIPFVIRKEDRVPFYWANKKEEKNICIKSVNEVLSPNKREQLEFEWSCGFPISELGTLSVQNRQTPASSSYAFKDDQIETRFFRIDRRLHNNTIFIIVEDENPKYPTYKIENFSKNFAIRYSQVNEHQFCELINVQESMPFAWSNYRGVHELQVEFFHGDINENSYFIHEFIQTFPLDQLNYKAVIKIPIRQQEDLGIFQTQDLHVSTFTNGYTKVIRFSDSNNLNVASTNDHGEDEDNPNVDENNRPMSLYEIYLKQVNLSLISTQKELLTIYIQRIVAKVVDSDIDTKCEFEIGYIQFDNQSEIDPIYPVVLKPKYIKPEIEQDNEDENTPNRTPRMASSQPGVFQLSLDFRKNIPHVIYFELIDYLLQTLELKLEFSHIILLSNMVSDVGSKMNKKLTWMHQIFEADSANSQNQDDEEYKTFFDIVPHENKASGLFTKKNNKITDFGTEEVKLDLTNNNNRLNYGRQKSVDVHNDFKNKLRTRTVASSLGLNKIPSEKVSSNLVRHQSTKDKDLLRKLYSQDMSKKTMVQRANWRSEKFKHKSKRFYIKEYKGSPLEIELSIMNKGTFDMQDSDILRTISSLGLVLSSIDCAPVKVNALLLNNVFGDYDDVVNQLRKHHMEKVKWNILKIIGASNLLGNPINFVNALGTGVQDFYYQPRQGFVKGPIQGGIGILKGTSSLVKNTFIGTFGSAGKIVQSVSKGLLVLSNDKEFIYKRDVDNIKKKPKNVFQGMKFGFKNAMHSFGSGITGVITQPIEESKKGGVLGFFKGTAKGMAGLVVKPVSGTLDFFSMTTEGIKNTSKNEEELALDRRLRLPRAFYEKEKIIREYDEFHAFLTNLVPKLKNEISCDCFFDACLVDCQDQSWSIFFLTLNNIAMIVAEGRNNNNQISIQWSYDTRKIRYVEIVEETGLTLGFVDKNLNIQFGEAYLAERIRQKIDKIINTFK